MGKLKKLEGVEEFDLSSSLLRNMRAYEGRYVGIYLGSGQKIRGFLKGIGEDDIDGGDILHLAMLEGEAMKDVLINIRAIVGFDMKVRKPPNEPDPTVLADYDD